MKKKILICSIFRNREKFIKRWHYQIKSFIDVLSNEYTFDISIYENDSVDNTVQNLKILNYNFFNKAVLKTENKNTNFYGSVKNEDRVKNLALARNECLNSNVLNLSDYEKIIFIEPDFNYKTEDAIKIISADKIHNKKIDIVSGLSLYYGMFYDSWATRKTDLDKEGHIAYNSDGTLEDYWSTFNGFCVYNAEPFAKGIRFDWFNKRLNIYDCDTTVVCELFRENGYNNIFVDTSAVFHHED
jgi:hypothetical protein